ncbi:HNH endonuclease [Pseudomonas chlororaphis]|uniref:HNH endonuclease n=1 Tax=Pseudomonas chlororaphis TaxID=587753 RepID=UPI0019CFC941|nr:HNH endonuclease [Pseudomonas chlororaphis]
MQNYTPMPLLEALQRTYAIDPASPSGLSRIKASIGRYGKIGPVLSVGTDGYFRMKFEGICYRTHRVIYYLHHKADPGALVVDHIDGDPKNNRVENLRACTQQENLWNAKGRPKRSGLPKGIERMSDGTYRVKVSVNREPHSITLSNFKAALNYTKSVRERHHGNFARQ